MPAPTPVPDRFLARPFRREELLAAGLSPKILLGNRFQQVFPNVWAPARELDHAELISAATLSLTDRAHPSHITRIQALGLNHGDREPLHFTVQGDLHIDTDGIFLHRTVAMPPTDDDGVTPAAAFVQCCADLRLIDLVVIGDWLLRHGHTTIEEMSQVASLHPWRPGAEQVASVLPWLDGRARSPKESELRALIVACGLPVPEVNAELVDGHGRLVATVDLLFRAWLVVVEYEGRQHAEDAYQFARDIGRYADLRRLAAAYEQVTARHLASPRVAMTRIHRLLAERGYDGPAPQFGPRWLRLFEPIPLRSTPRRAVR